MTEIKHAKDNLYSYELACKYTFSHGSILLVATVTTHDNIFIILVKHVANVIGKII